MQVKRPLASLLVSSCIAGLMVSGVEAATFSISGGTAGVLPTAYDPSAALTADGIIDGTSIRKFGPPSAAGAGLFISPQNVDLTFTFMGREAGFNSLSETDFVYDGVDILTNSQAVGTSVTVSYSLGTDPGLVPFLFRRLCCVGGSPGQADAINGGAIASTLQIAFHVVSGGQIAYAFFDDGGGGNPADADFDDMVVRITAAERATGEVPIPGALILFASGLLGLTALGRRRMRPSPQVAS